MDIEKCKHGKYLNLDWVSFFNQVDGEFEECCVCGQRRRKPLYDYQFKEDVEKINIDDLYNDSSISAAEDKVDADLALKRLKPKQQKIIKLKAEGYTYKEIGERLSLSKKTIDWHIQEARKRGYGAPE